MHSPSEHLQYLKRKEWQTMPGKRGNVYSFTTPTVPPAGFELLAPYDLLWVRFLDETLGTYMGAYGEKFEIGDEVECFVGAFPDGDERGLITYRVKVRHPVVPSVKQQAPEK